MMVNSTGLFLSSKMLCPWLQHHHHSQVQVPFLKKTPPVPGGRVSLLTTGKPTLKEEDALW